MITADGTVYEGAKALLFVGARMGYGGVTWIGWIPPNIWILQLGYRFMAKNRGIFASFLFRSETGGPFAPPDR